MHPNFPQSTSTIKHTAEIMNTSNNPNSDEISLGNSGQLSSNSIAAVLFGEDPSQCDTAPSSGGVVASLTSSGGENPL